MRSLLFFLAACALLPHALGGVLMLGMVVLILMGRL